MKSNLKNTDISWITTLRKEDGEWCSYKKSFSLDNDAVCAVIRFESDCVCAVYINGEFITSGTGRYPERVSCYEVTSKLYMGSNTIELVTGGHYFQGFGSSSKEKRGYWLNQVAFELEISFEDGESLNIPTDKSWLASNLNENVHIIETMRVTSSEYDTMWKNAAYYEETDLYNPKISGEVLSVVGEDYVKYVNEKTPKIISCDNIISTDMDLTDGYWQAKNNTKECYLIIDLGRLAVGYTEFEYKLTGDVSFDAMFDYSEEIEDFEPDNENELVRTFVKRLLITEKLDENKCFYQNLRRRAFRYMKLIFKGDLDSFKIRNLSLRQEIFPDKEKGYFKCSDEILNKAWEMGKYTLLVNKHQEYESCPRNEMLFFAGDGAIDALIDIYAFGNCDMLASSLSVKHEASAIGLATYNKFNRTVWQWDYFAWRIICIYNYYLHTGNKDFLNNHYDEAVNNVLWLTERMNERDLLFQTPGFHSTFSSTMIQVDWACSIHRLGENAFLNCLLYKSFVCMAELANEMNDRKREEEWRLLAERVKKAINTYLWDEEKQAYVDGIGDYIAQDANALAVIFGVADKKRALSALKTVKERLWSPYGSTMADVEFKNGDLRGGNTTISPMMSTHEAVAWFMKDKPEEGLELIRRVWGTMINKGATTFWEYAPNNADGRWEAPCHAWSAGCTYLLSAFVMGIRPTAPNWKSIIFAPRPCDLELGKCVVPTPYGLIAASWEKNNDAVFSFKLALPNAIKLITELPKNSTIEIINY